LTEFSKGDVVTVRAVVKYHHHQDHHETRTVSVLFNGHYETVFVEPEALTLVHHHFNVGDRVRSENYESHAIVRGVFKDDAWIELEAVENDDFAMVTTELADLKHAPADDEADDAADDAADEKKLSAS
jgi:hypothetical protein